MIEPKMEMGKENKASMNLFIDKLFGMLCERTYQKVISWDPDGLTFSIHDPVKFTETVLNKHFKHNNLFSFIRQLNLYDFHKLRRDTHKGHQ
jgi:osomolarity two-component system response regulator SKN7